MQMIPRAVDESHGGKQELAVLARVQGADRRAGEGRSQSRVSGQGVRPVGVLRGALPQCGNRGKLIFPGWQ